MTPEQLKKIVPLISDTNLNNYTPLLNTAFDKYQINTVERQCCFIAQVAHESESFRYTKELASGQAYEGRVDLGNTMVGDGVKFKGRGLIQTTGRKNYQLCSQFIFGDERLLEHPEYLEEPEYAVASACFYWTSHILNEICDSDANWTHTWKEKVYTRFQWLTVKINGGLNGYADRLAFYLKAKEVLGPNPVNSQITSENIPEAKGLEIS